MPLRMTNVADRTMHVFRWSIDLQLQYEDGHLRESRGANWGSPREIVSGLNAITNVT